MCDPGLQYEIDLILTHIDENMAAVRLLIDREIDHATDPYNSTSHDRLEDMYRIKGKLMGMKNEA